MKLPTDILAGMSFGLTSGIITTLGVLIGLGSGTESKTVVIGAILVIALSDSFSDAMGIHMLRESEKESETNILKSSVAAFIGKLAFALTFIIPIVLLPLNTAMVASIVWGIVCISLLSYCIARIRRESVIAFVVEHVVVALFVIAISRLIGTAIARTLA